MGWHARKTPSLDAGFQKVYPARPTLQPFKPLHCPRVPGELITDNDKAVRHQRFALRIVSSGV